MKLQTKANIGIISVFLLLGASVAYMTYRWQTDHAVKAAENRVRLYIKAGWEIYNSKIERIQATLQVLAEDQRLARLLRERDDNKLLAEALKELQVIRTDQNMDILNLLDASGRVVLRSRHPGRSGDLVADPMIRRVLKERRPCGGTILMHGLRMEAEGQDLVSLCWQSGGARTFSQELGPTPETVVGMMTAAAVPVFDEQKRLVGVIQMGNLLNGSVEKVDRIRNSLFENEQYGSKPVGTATVFMRDLRISTNVLGKDGRRAVGTRASEEVADLVLGKGKSWTGRALVVNAWYLSQYDPIRDPDGQVIGMLYIGSLEQRYLDQRWRAIAINLAMVFGGMLLAMAVFFLIFRTILSPVKRLHLATRKLSSGDLRYRIDVRSQDEIGELSQSFNQMAEQLLENQREIQQSHDELESRNEELRTINRSYMDVLGFVSHELKAPLASAVLGVYSVKDGYLGPVSESQKRVLGNAGQSLDYLNEMIKHYLDLSRLEKGELTVSARRVALGREIIAPVLEGLSASLEKSQMQVENCVPSEFGVDCDPNLIRIVYDNLFSNAIKYGRTGGTIALEAENTAEGWVLTVANQGDGIAAGKLGLLFKKFSRIDHPKNAGKKGTGLGLYICKEIVEQHGGKISARTEGQWTKFTFTLPLSGAHPVRGQKDESKSEDSRG